MLVVNDDSKLHGSYEKYYIYKVTDKTLDSFVKALENQKINTFNLKEMEREAKRYCYVFCMIRKTRDKKDFLDFFYGNPQYQYHMYNQNKIIKYNKTSLESN